MQLHLELKSKVEAVKSGNSFTPTTKSTPIVTPNGKTIKATTSKDAVTTNENGEKVRATKSADGIAGKYKSVVEFFWSATEFDRYKSGLADKFNKGKGPSLISLDGNSDWEFYTLPLKHEPVEIKKIMWAQWKLESAGRGVGSGDGLIAKMKKTNPLDPNNLAVVNSPSVLIGKTLDFGPNAGSRQLKLPIGNPLYIAVRYNILDTTDSNYVSAPPKVVKNEPKLPQGVSPDSVTGGWRAFNSATGKAKGFAYNDLAGAEAFASGGG